jgi:dTDP-4-dehydrorhamnose reductase
MRILVIGGDGMAGHMIRDYLSYKRDWEVWHTTRKSKNSENSQLQRRIHLDATHYNNVLPLLTEIKPDVVINAIGILNEFAEKNQKEAILINSLFPHLLAASSEQLSFRLIHLSTDCVFSGTRGDYTETDCTDGTSIYAKSKSLGEVFTKPHVTIRTSIIGPELKEEGIGLFHWFMKQKGQINGYNQVLWNGITTLELAKTIESIIEHPITGLIHLTSPQKISKYNLLRIIKKIFQQHQIDIQPCNQISSDKSLLNTHSDLPNRVAPYETMIEELRDWMQSKTQRTYPY